MAITLQEVVQALEAKDVLVAADLGVHEFCTIDSNCPKAVEIRRIIGESGITLQELLEGIAQPIVERLVDDSIQQAPQDSHADLTIMGQNITVDLAPIMSQQLRTVLLRKMDELEEIKHRTAQLARSYNVAYWREVQRLRNQKQLPQLSFPVAELAKAKCMITTDSQNYVFLFLVKYQPEYIINNGIRSRLSDQHINELSRDAMIQFKITPEKKYLGALMLDMSGNKMQHYHGGHTADCWGTSYRFPTEWDRTLKQVYQISQTLLKMVNTINYNSLMKRLPSGMPDVEDVLRDSTTIGREGIIEPVEATPQEVQDGGWRAAAEVINAQAGHFTIGVPRWGTRR